MDEQMTPKEKLAASTEILAAVSAATVAASVQMEPEELNAPKREFGSVAYERVLTERECHCVERTAKKLKVLGKLIHVWVKDARSYRHGVESEVYVHFLLKS
ncbi:hypothetical protein P3T76_003967 [Phytophthora citrophthora]|uniref:Uncharacterized protein n=1 Tax=Phytophthora citrophthora TaxID=4793 RepID=A0AAD9GT35_9STRA|nr:hypothetical protein P3T76_003967 [Phytophthora citrophthora]